MFKVASLLVSVFFLSMVTQSGALEPFVGGYLLLPRKDSSQKIVGLDELKALASQASSIPVTRVILSFFSPTMVYEPSSNTLEYTGLNVSTSGDYGFADIKDATKTLQDAGVEVFLSIGGWNYNCYPYFYMRYSVGGYGTDTPNYWKIQKYAGGDMSKCDSSNQFCFVCEPESEGTDVSDFSIFPEPDFSDTWQSAVKYVAEGAKAAGVDPKWNTDMIPGSMYTDPQTGLSTMVPGSSMYHDKKRDPYQDIVYLAKDLGVAGIDLDYEEFWHADLFKTGDGPWNLTQTVYKYVAIGMDIATNIKAVDPSLKLSTAGGAVGAWEGNWWGGNLKGVWYYAKQWFPFFMDFMTTGDNAGGVNVMSYDLSDNSKFHECPKDDICQLDQQVDYYMSQYKSANIPAAVGYEVSTPAYPDKTEDPDHQLPLTKDMLTSITGKTQKLFPAGFLWELFKPVDSPDHASPTEVAQAICKVVMPASSRCSGSIPSLSDVAHANSCDPNTCSVCQECCKSYISLAQNVCDACVREECASPLTQNIRPKAPRRS